MKTYTDRIADTNSSLDSMQAKVRELRRFQVGEALGYGAFIGVPTTMPQLSAGRGSMGLYKPVSEGGVQRCS